MALHGDLDSFALPDVLRLLAGTGKTGRLAVTAEPTSGEIWLLDGDLVGGRIDAAPHASEPADVVFELIRLENGAFVFEDGERLVDGAERARVNDAIEAAEAMVLDWAEVETVVPSVHASVRMVTEIEGDSVTVASGPWRLIAAMGADTTVRRLGDRFAMTDLVVSREVKALVEAGLVELGDVVEPEPVESIDAGQDVAEVETAPELEGDPGAEHDDENTEIEADLGVDGAHLELDGPPPALDDLAILRDVDAAVVMENSDDAHLPEPLPGEGTAFAADIAGIGTVDGRSFESFEQPVAAPAPEPDPAANNDATWASFNALEADGEPAAELEDEAEAEADDDRGSLMRFLSQVDN